MKGDPLQYVRKIASDVFNMLAGDAEGEAPPESIDDWDSMQRLNLVLALEEHFGIEFTTEEIERMKTLSDFVWVVGGKQGQDWVRQTESSKRTDDD